MHCGSQISGLSVNLSFTICLLNFRLIFDFFFDVLSFWCYQACCNRVFFFKTLSFSDSSSPAAGVAGKYPSGPGDQQNRPLDCGAEAHPSGSISTP